MPLQSGRPSSPQERRRRHRLGRTGQRRVFAPARVGVAADRVADGIESGDGSSGDGDRQAALVGQPGRKVGAGLMHRGRDERIHHQEQPAGHALAVRLLTVGIVHRRARS
jgi:hypothetical protein